MITRFFCHLAKNLISLIIDSLDIGENFYLLAKILPMPSNVMFKFFDTDVALLMLKTLTNIFVYLFGDLFVIAILAF